MKKILYLLSLVVILLITGCSNQITGKAIKEIGGTVKEITVDAFQFGYTPDTINIKNGERIRININNVDVPHGIRIPDLGLKGENVIEFTADKSGEFTWYCLIPCGQGHMQMKGKLVVN